MNSLVDHQQAMQSELLRVTLRDRWPLLDALLSTSPNDFLQVESGMKYAHLYCYCMTGYCPATEITAALAGGHTISRTARAAEKGHLAPSIHERPLGI